MRDVQAGTQTNSLRLHVPLLCLHQVSDSRGEVCDGWDAVTSGPYYETSWRLGLLEYKNFFGLGNNAPPALPYGEKYNNGPNGLRIKPLTYIPYDKSRSDDLVSSAMMGNGSYAVDILS